MIPSAAPSTSNYARDTICPFGGNDASLYRVRVQIRLVAHFRTRSHDYLNLV
jgi:hypothetical protein